MRLLCERSLILAVISGCYQETITAHEVYLRLFSAALRPSTRRKLAPFYSYKSYDKGFCTSSYLCDSRPKISAVGGFSSVAVLILYKQNFCFNSHYPVHSFVFIHFCVLYKREYNP